MPNYQVSSDGSVADSLDDGHAGGAACFELIDALGGFFVVEKRSATLDGSIPLRAAQGCKPFLAGNEAGFQLRLAEPAVIHIVEGELELHVRERAASRIGAEYEQRVERLVSAGLLCRDGYWHRVLRDGFAWGTRDRVCLWSGLLVRAAPNTRVLLTGAFNRRVRATIQDCVIADEHGFVPVVLELSASSFSAGELWLDTELACLLPVSAEVEFDVCSIDDEPSVGEEFIRFYSDEYGDKRRAGGIAGDYRRLVAGETDDRWDQDGHCQLIFAGPDAHTIESFHRFATSAGVSSADPSGRKLMFAVVRNIGEVSGRFDGLAVRDVSFDGDQLLPPAREQWLSLHGQRGAALFDGYAVYANAARRPRVEPSLIIKTWAFVRTPPGWSSVLDGVHLDAADGLRGVQSTDAFHGIGALLQFVNPGAFTIGAGEALERVLPVPRALLRAPFRTLTITDAAA